MSIPMGGTWDESHDRGGGRRAQGDPTHAYVRLSFEVEPAPLPSRLAGLLEDVEVIYRLAAEETGSAQENDVWLPPSPPHESPSSTGSVEGLAVVLLRFGSPFDVLLQIPWEAWTAAGTGFVGGIATIFGLPLKGAARVQEARRDFWRARLEADEAKQAWVEAAKQRNEQAELREMTTSRLDFEETPAGANR